jgi:hypothetical protein
MGSWFRTYPLSGKMLRGFEIGHLTDESKMDYVRAPDWQAGFAIAHVVGPEQFPHMQLIQINETDRGLTCVVDGKVFHN